MIGETQIIVERLPSKEEIEARFNKNIAELWQQDRNELDQLRADNARLKGEVDLINGFREQLRSKFNRKCDTLREAMAIIESLRADNARLKGDVQEWREKYQEEYKIVDRVWRALGITSYYHAQPNAIWEHVSKLNSTLATYKAAVVEAREALEHCRNRPHEHNPISNEGLPVRCEVIDRALHTLSALTGDATPNPLKSPSF